MENIFVRLMDGRKVNVKDVIKDNNIREWKVVVTDENDKKEVLDISQIHTIGGT
ncbi:hypothetical protein [Staphylococcus gallinarum]|uniref:hypothetical protein n=1 Tax=Staphylococcus gallinarum TaxID=1293 RepID=UPI001E51B6B3|nr:hypothetical protein [Staphylococcus gallinarum]MCD8845169.1 hypothetical protein [Staphylococcus gallinarum]